MTKNLRKIFYWNPRILGILFTIFIALFALDVFNENLSLGSTIIAFLIHLIPSLIILFFLFLAWKWEWIGSILFFGLALYYLFGNWGKFHWSAYAVISGVMTLIALLFLVSWKFGER